MADWTAAQGRAGEVGDAGSSPRAASTQTQSPARPIPAFQRHPLAPATLSPSSRPRSSQLSQPALVGLPASWGRSSVQGSSCRAGQEGGRTSTRSRLRSIWSSSSLLRCCSPGPSWSWLASTSGRPLARPARRCRCRRCGCVGERGWARVRSAWLRGRRSVPGLACGAGMQPPWLHHTKQAGPGVQASGCRPGYSQRPHLPATGQGPLQRRGAGQL